MLKFCSLTRRKSKAKDSGEVFPNRRTSLDQDAIKDLIKQRKPIILALSRLLLRKAGNYVSNLKHFLIL